MVKIKIFYLFLKQIEKNFRWTFSTLRKKKIKKVLYRLSIVYIFRTGEKKLFLIDCWSYKLEKLLPVFGFLQLSLLWTRCGALVEHVSVWEKKNFFFETDVFFIKIIKFWVLPFWYKKHLSKSLQSPTVTFKWKP